MVHTFELVVFWVSWEERIRKQFGEGEASVLGPVLHVVSYSWLQLLHELWAGRSQLLYDFIPLVNIWTLGVKENSTQAPDPNPPVWPLPGNPQRFPLPPCSLCRCILFHYYAPGSSCPPRTLISHMSILSISIAHTQTQPQVWEWQVGNRFSCLKRNLITSNLYWTLWFSPSDFVSLSQSLHTR